MTCEGGSIPVTLTLQQATGKNVLLLPVGAADDGAHSQNEKLDIRNYIEGVSKRRFLIKTQNKQKMEKIIYTFSCFRRQNCLVHIFMKWVNYLKNFFHAYLNIY